MGTPGKWRSVKTSTFNTTAVPTRPVPKERPNAPMFDLAEGDDEATGSTEVPVSKHQASQNTYLEKLKATENLMKGNHIF